MPAPIIPIAKPWNAPLHDWKAAPPPTSSFGMAGIESVFRFSPGDHAILSEAVYGGVFRLATPAPPGFRPPFTFTGYLFPRKRRPQRHPPRHSHALYRDAHQSHHASVTDIAAVSALAAQNGAKAGKGITVVVDNTFLSPLFPAPSLARRAYRRPFHDQIPQRPFRLHRRRGHPFPPRRRRAHLLHPAFRQRQASLPWIAFSSPAASRPSPSEWTAAIPTASPSPAFFIPTPKSAASSIPDCLPTPGAEYARRQQSGFGAMISFDLGSLDAARALLNNVRLCSLAESLGGVETLISHPASHDPRFHARRSPRAYRHHRRSCPPLR